MQPAANAIPPCPGTGGPPSSPVPSLPVSSNPPTPQSMAASTLSSSSLPTTPQPVAGAALASVEPPPQTPLRLRQSSPVDLTNDATSPVSDLDLDLGVVNALKRNQKSSFRSYLKRHPHAFAALPRPNAHRMAQAINVNWSVDIKFVEGVDLTWKGLSANPGHLVLTRELCVSAFLQAALSSVPTNELFESLKGMGLEENCVTQVQALKDLLLYKNVAETLFLLASYHLDEQV